MYKTEVYGKNVIYTDECIVYGDLEINYKDMSNIQHIGGDKRAFRFTYQGKVVEIPYLMGERDIIMPFYRKAASISPEIDPIEKNENEAETSEPKAERVEPNASGYYNAEQTYHCAGGFSNYSNGYRTFEKNVFTWVFCFLLGGFGVDRFVRGQIGLGIVKLLFGWLTLGIWYLVDWIIAMVKAYGASFGGEENFVFDMRGNYIR